MVKYVNPRDCIPLKELEREYYDQSNFSYLTKVIEKDGFNSSYAPRAIYNEEIGKYEVFDGIHRLLIALKLGITQMPLVDETGLLTRQQAFFLYIFPCFTMRKTIARYRQRRDQTRL